MTREVSWLRSGLLATNSYVATNYPLAENCYIPVEIRGTAACKKEEKQRDHRRNRAIEMNQSESQQ